MTNQILLYDHERDKDLKEGEAILVFEDGTTRRIRESSLYKKEEANVRQPAKVQRPNLIRSRTTREIKHRKVNPRQTPKGKRLPVYQA